MVYGVWPDFKMIIPGIITLTLILAPWWPAEYFGYMTTMGPGALYMSYTTGNVTNLRMPATVGTMYALELGAITDDGDHSLRRVEYNDDRTFVSGNVVFRSIKAHSTE